MKQPRLLFVALTLALALSACGGSTTAPNTASEKLFEK